MNPAVSIILPVYNVEKYIDRCIKSILNQTFQNFEIIIVNDRTPDSSMDIVRKYATHDSRITICENHENMGSAWSRKEGYLRAQGDYLYFCDSDDYLLGNAIEILYAKIVETGVDIVKGALQYFPIEGNPVITNNKLSYTSDKVSIYRLLLNREMSHSLCGSLFSRDLFLNYDYFTPVKTNKSTDALLFYQIIDNLNNGLATVDQVTYNYLQNKDSVTNRRLSDEEIKQAVTFINFRCKILYKYKELSDELAKSSSIEIIALLKHNYNIKIISDNISELDTKQLFAFNNLLKHHSFSRSFLYYMLWNSSYLRYLYNYMMKNRVIHQLMQNIQKLNRNAN